jgi:hypothetical protein
MMIDPTNTTTHPRPDTRSDAPIEYPLASSIEPGVAVPQAALELDLESRISLRRAELISKLRELKTDTRVGVAEVRDKLKATLSELAHVVKWGVVDGWANVSGPVTHKLEQWLTGSSRETATKSESP